MTVQLSAATIAKVKALFGDNTSDAQNFIVGVVQYVDDIGSDAALKNFAEQKRIIEAQLAIVKDLLTQKKG